MLNYNCFKFSFLIINIFHYYIYIINKYIHSIVKNLLIKFSNMLKWLPTTDIVIVNHDIVNQNL